MAKIVILGGGFAAVSAAEVLAPFASEHEVTLISNKRDFTFFPGIVPMVFGDLEEKELHFDLKKVVEKRGIRVVQGSVKGVSPEFKTIALAGDEHDWLAYDFLIVAMGRRLDRDRIPGLREHANHLLTVEAAEAFKDAVAAFKKGPIVLGMCPGSSLPIPVCESALALAGRFENEIAAGNVSITVIFPSTLETALAGSGLFRDVEGEFAARGISLVSEYPIERVTETTIESPLAGPIRHDLLLLIPPFAGHSALAELNATGAGHGFLSVDEHLQVKGISGVYAAGDIADMPGPKFGFSAIRQGRIAAMNVLDELKGRSPGNRYKHEIPWILGEEYTDPIYFHYGFWDDTANGFEDGALFGMAKLIRERYGKVNVKSFARLAGA
jgi:sulfide:quinone oxidoreductase